MIKPTPTTCMAISFEIPNREHAIGIRRREPPATPDAPHAPRADITDSRIAAGTETFMPRVFAAARVIIIIVIAAPSMLMVAQSGIDTEYISLSSPSFSQSAMLIGMFAAELLVKKAVRPDSFRHLKTSGYGFTRRCRKMMNGEITSAIRSMVPTRRTSSYSASALATMTKTRTGAMAFNAPTNRLPNSSIHAACGTASARTAPTIRPMTMRRIRLVLLYFSTTFFSVFIVISLLQIFCFMPRIRFRRQDTSGTPEYL